MTRIHVTAQKLQILILNYKMKISLPVSIQTKKVLRTLSHGLFDLRRMGNYQ